MSKGSVGPATRLLKGVDQFDVDFVIPRLEADLPIGIDPFLLYKSRDPLFREMHKAVLRVFGEGLRAVHGGQLSEARRLLDFPEPAEIGMGYAKGTKRGSGIGDHLAGLIIDTLQGAPALQERGIKHIEEFQLLSVGIGADRISDIAADILKATLIDYTQRQCELWSIPLASGVPVEHVLDLDALEWSDGHYDLPTSPVDGSPIILVPRRIVRALPWINYDDYVRSEFASYLRAKRSHDATDSGRGSASLAKTDIVTVSRQEMERVDRYVTRKEEQAQDAQPSSEYLGDASQVEQAQRLRVRLSGTPTGLKDAHDFQRLALEILNFLFNPELIDGRLEVRTIDGTERRDIIFTNDSDATFWSYLRSEHSSLLLMFEAKNKDKLSNSDIAQVATYLGDRLGRLGFMLVRSAPGVNQTRKAFSVYNDSHPRKIILFLSDDDLHEMLDMTCKGKNAMRHVQSVYRHFRTTVQ
jgi:hypothetical protein